MPRSGIDNYGRPTNENKAAANGQAPYNQGGSTHGGGAGRRPNNGSNNNGLVNTGVLSSDYSHLFNNYNTNFNENGRPVYTNLDEPKHLTAIQSMQKNRANARPHDADKFAERQAYDLADFANDAGVHEKVYKSKDLYIEEYRRQQRKKYAKDINDDIEYHQRLMAEQQDPAHVFTANSSLKFNESSEDIQDYIMANGIYDRYSMNWDEKFARLGIIDPYNTKTNTKEYLFFTKPDLCIFNSTGDIRPELAAISPFFKDAVIRFRKSAAQLQSSAGICKGSFMAMLSNAVTSSLDIPGISGDMVETAANINGTKISYRASSRKSDEDLDFSLEFEDTKYLDIYMLFRMWDEYEKLKWNGLIDFINWSGCDRWCNYIVNKVLHDQISIYKIIVAEDGYRIIYMARMVGVVPNSIPRDAFSDMSDHGPQKLSVGFKGHWIRDVDPIIVYHFNKLVGNVSNKEELPLFHVATSSKENPPEYHGIDGRWSSTPYIYTKIDKSSSRGKEYYLRWKL